MKDKPHDPKVKELMFIAAELICNVIDAASKEGKTRVNLSSLLEDPRLSHYKRTTALAADFKRYLGLPTSNYLGIMSRSDWSVTKKVNIPAEIEQGIDPKAIAARYGMSIELFEQSFRYKCGKTVAEVQKKSS